MTAATTSSASEAEWAMVSPSPATTHNIGCWLGERLWAGAFVALTGELGAGKTALATGILAGLGVARTGGSPTFPLLWEYQQGRLPVYHWDVYRLEEPEDLEHLGYEDSFYGDGVCLVEWAERVRRFWPAEWLRVRLQPAGTALDAERELQFQAVGADYVTLLGELVHAHIGV